MGLFDFIKTEKHINLVKQSKGVKNSVDSFADSSSISPDEKQYYQSDNYYTYYSYPGTDLAVRVITFEERKTLTYPSVRGLYVAEILLLAYCSSGKYPKPDGGYPGFWWFKYGIRDVGHALQSLEERGFVKWGSRYTVLQTLKVDALKQILIDEGLSTAGKKEDLIARIKTNVPEDKLNIPDYVPKYELTELGKQELEENGYVPYMHKHKQLTTEDSRFGETFTVWDVNKLFHGGDASGWRQIVGDIEKTRFGVNMANAVSKGIPKNNATEEHLSKDEMRSFLASKKEEIAAGIKTAGDGFTEETQGMSLKAAGKDKEALVKFYIAIGKQFDAPALYRETAKILRKYKMYEEELSVINAGLLTIPKNSNHREELLERKKKVKDYLKRSN